MVFPLLLPTFMLQRAKATAGSGSSKSAPKKKQKKDPNAPKGASSAFMQFATAHRSAVRCAHAARVFPV